MIWEKLKITLQMIKFEHTVFALPFALIAVLLAAGGLPEARTLVWIVVAMVAARSAAMTFNRIVDLEYDRANPRTRERALPAGRLSRTFAAAFTTVMALLFVGAAGMLNRWCLYLAPPTLAILFGYSYSKRFTAWSHMFLGFAIGLAPVGAWLAVLGRLDWTPVLLGASVMSWIAGFDIIYACQDVEFDRRRRLFSLPSRLGLKHALAASSILHVVTVALLLVVARLNGLGWITYAGIILVAAILYWEHRIVRPDDLTRVDVAFFDLNGYVSLALLAAVGADVLVI